MTATGIEPRHTWGSPARSPPVPPPGQMPDRGQSKARQGPVKGLAGTWLGPAGAGWGLAKKLNFFQLAVFFSGGGRSNFANWYRPRSQNRQLSLRANC